MPSHVSALFIGRTDKVSGNVRAHREVTTQKLHTQSTAVQGLVDEFVDFFFIRLGTADRFRRISSFQNSDVQTGTVDGRFFQNAVQGTGHVQAGRDTFHRQHAMTVMRAVHTTDMHVRVDDTGLQDHARVVIFFCTGLFDLRRNQGNLTVFDGHISHRVKTVHRIDDTSTAKYAIKHDDSPLFR